MSDWDMQSKTYETVIRYYCPEKGYGYSSDGANERYSICMSDGHWNLTQIEDCVCMYLIELYYREFPFTIPEI